MTSGGGARALRLAAVLLLAAAASFQVIRTAAVADRESRPRLAQALWPGHPRIMTDRALLAVAEAAKAGEGVSPSLRAEVRRLAVKAPLSSDPFLIEGAIAETEKRSADAEQLLVAARSRDPRSRAARYLLADRYLRTGRITEALVEMQALVSLQGGGEVFAPAVAAYARTPGAAEELRAFFRRYPRVEAAVLTQLAFDAANADLVLSLARNPDPDPDWRRTLIATLIGAGDYRRAHAIWVRVGGGAPGRGLFNPSFQPVAALPPFNWEFPQVPDGVAEPDGRGGLDVLYYGRGDSALARQLLILPPGPGYRLAASASQVSGEEGALRWLLRCAGDHRPIADLPIRQGRSAARFAVPAGCDAQWLELRGKAGDIPRTSELKMSGLELTRGQAQ